MNDLVLAPCQPYIGLILWVKWVKGYISLSHLYNIDRRQSNLVCMCMSTSPSFKFDILPNIQLTIFITLTLHNTKILL